MIQELPPDVVAQIAAGEVVERPASAVKELVENAIDAGSRRVDVTVSVNPFDTIVVSDDGAGIPAEDLPRAVARHATSKITTFADLRGLATLGFRGEALAALARVGHLTLVSRCAEEPVGSRLDIAYGGQIIQRPAARGPGTTVTLRRLFEQLPARRASQARTDTEEHAILRLVRAYALTHPAISFSYTRTGDHPERLFSTPGDGDLVTVLQMLYPDRLARSLIAIAGEDAGVARISGVLSPPGLTRAAREHLVVAVNGRPVLQPEIVAAVARGYATALPSGRYPVGLLRIDVPPAAVDVNIHPAKRAVNLAQLRAVQTLVTTAVERALGRTSSVAGDRPVAALPPREGVERLRRATLLGQWGDLFLIASDLEYLYLVDQHAAHERVLYEQLRRGGRPMELPAPLAITLGPVEAQRLLAATDRLATYGLAIAPFGPDRVLVRAIPEPWQGLAIGEVLSDLVEEIATFDDASAVLARAACRRAIRAGQTWGRERLEALLHELASCPQADRCLHGRPTFLQLDRASAFRIFERPPEADS